MPCGVHHVGFGIVELEQVFIISKMIYLPLILICLIIFVSGISGLSLNPKRIEYRQHYELCGLASDSGNPRKIREPFSSLPSWSVGFEKHPNGKIGAVVEMTRHDDISHTVIRHVQFKIKSGSVQWTSGNRDFPSKFGDGLKFGLGIELDIPENKDCMDVQVGIIFNDVENQVKAVNEYLEAHPDTIGHLDEHDLDQLSSLRKTEMKFYADENEQELLHTSLVDLHAMAQLSHYIRGLLRFNQHKSGGELVCPKSSKMICVYFDEETVTDLLDITHGKQFKRQYFIEKSMDYLIRMGYISHEFAIPSLQIMIDDCIFNKAKRRASNIRNIGALKAALEYALNMKHIKLFVKLWGIVDLLAFLKESSEYQELRKLISNYVDEMAMVVANVVLRN